MTLYIHFGIYKAGSSYIQYICANQRDYLNSNSIYFPISKEDKKMISGLISKGNADGLDLALKNEDESQIGSILQKWHKEAKVKNCDSILISSEALVHQIALQKRLDLIKIAASSIGYNQIKVMGFFRDLADHALSTYKHRGKSGTIPNYVHWVSEVYETPKLLENLSHVIAHNKDIQWALRKFKKDSEFLKLAFFKDWLGIDIPKFETRANVNESITLSEVKVMNHIRKIYPTVTDYFYQALKVLPKAAKAKDKDLDNYILSIFITQLIPSRNRIENINIYFPEEEHLGIGDSIFTCKDEPSIQLSDNQLQVLTKCIAFFNSWRGRKVLMRRRLVQLIKKNNRKRL
jgi:hypothetical protein